ncbi:hypothetical protein CUC43_33995 (plasmid) [Bacillus thuringiensis LM1212]|uniref:DUF3967 domain-containing protein n=1 Tax=Bacillus cereus group TaxID=86661 RepID=UPI000E59E16B|nr:MULTISPECIES: DUF3967 domain-containing protein [Bacillus cereus group]AXY11576.1 hypothetical protein CUC43_33995 [Bacillus thuringiensis LM1212]QDF27455.1 MerR family transcriptional regulator [Bacillus tropicus]QUG99336.1 MerR family transcriptional regulator [Bacillus tropicus]
MNNVVSLEHPKRVINSKDVANTLNISFSTLRTYTAHFRRCGHSFIKQQGKVLYSEEDVKLLKRMIELHYEGQGTITECVKSVLNKENKEDTTDTHTNIASSSTSIQLEKDYKEIKTELNDLREEMKKISNYVDTRLEERDRILIRTLREVLEQKRLKQKWWMFWKKK